MPFLTAHHPAWVACLIGVLAIIASGCIAARLTPRAWWQRPSVLGIMGFAGASCLLGWGLWKMATPALPAMQSAAIQSGTNQSAAKSGISSGTGPNLANGTLRISPADTYQTHRALNLRQQPGTDAALRATLPVASLVWPTGLRQGDWWQVKSEYGTGWVSSLWLRQHARRRIQPE